MKKKYKKIKITLKKSLIGRNRKQKECVKGLGLKKINQSKTIKANNENKGMIKKIRFMLEIKG